MAVRSDARPGNADFHNLQQRQQASTSGQLEDVFMHEGDEDVEYVVVELDADMCRQLMAAGANLHIEGLDTEAPMLHLPDGKRVEGCYDQHLGSILVFQDQAGSPAAAGTAADDLLHCRCHTEKKLVFAK